MSLQGNGRILQRLQNRSDYAPIGLFSNTVFCITAHRYHHAVIKMREATLMKIGYTKATQKPENKKATPKNGLTV